MDDFLRQTAIDVSCPTCGSAVRPTLEEVRAERTVTCPNGHKIKLKDRGGALRTLDHELDDLTHKLGKAGVKINVTVRRR